VRTVLAALTALVIGFVIGPLLIRKFKQLKFGQRLHGRSHGCARGDVF
jgi:UDP-N-acetylmuramyl pentapeptide phosphotransferase/UDP-N-acetylglucosamine-1-phosphate transferase